MTVNNDPIYDEIEIKEITVKENSSYGTALATVPAQLSDHEGACENQETTTDDYEDMSQL